jgi:hypothetical protein
MIDFDEYFLTLEEEQVTPTGADFAEQIDVEPT